MSVKKSAKQENSKKREKRISKIRSMLDNASPGDLSHFLDTLKPQDIAEILQKFIVADKLRIFNALNLDDAAVVLDDTDPQTRLLILRESDNKKIARILDEMPVDEAADIIEDVTHEKREDLLDLMEKEDAEEVEEILSYPEDSAGRVMNPNFVSVRSDDSVEGAIGRIRSLQPDEDFYTVYVVDGESNFKGIISSSKMLLSSGDTRIKDIMDEDTHSVFVDTDREQAVIVMKKYDLLSLPVVEASGKLVGRITVDDIIDVIDEELAEDISKMTGTIEEEYGTETTGKATSNRLPWLITCMLGSIITGLVIQMFEVTLEEMIALVSFIPVITATGGNSGVQASTVVVRSIALGQMDFSKVWDEILRQLKIAVILGVACGGVLTMLAGFWKKNSMVGIITGISIFFVVIWSNLVGVLIPVMFKKLKIDPALASGPLITTLNDVIGVSIYLSIATAFLS